MSESWTDCAYWIGGGSCSGKSTVADALGELTGFRVVHLDDWLFEIVGESDEASSPAMNWYRTTDTGEWFAESGRRPVERYLDSLREEMEKSLPRLAKTVDSESIIEGNCFLPEFAGSLALPGRSVWMVATDEFREARYAEREFRHGILDVHTDPAAAWRNWMDRDHRQAAFVRASAGELGLEVVDVDGSETPLALAESIAVHLGLDTGTQANT
ncbi:MAG: hypothetical protein QF357_00385 [Dehalococcoidia bacterium]|nr:hypothetical protein [Dehalococcoidia bacterium]